MLLQVSMAVHGFDVPQSKKTPDMKRRREIFDIISPYCFSKSDLEEIMTYPQNIQDLWLQTFTNSQSVMLRTKLLQVSKEYFTVYFPNHGAAPKSRFGQKIGLQSGESILDR